MPIGTHTRTDTHRQNMVVRRSSLNNGAKIAAGTVSRSILLNRYHFTAVQPKIPAVGSLNPENESICASRMYVCRAGNASVGNTVNLRRLSATNFLPTGL